MSRYFPHTSYAEDQPLAHTILSVHVLTRGLTTGSLVGVTLASLRQISPRLRRAGPLTPQILLAASSRGGAFGVGLMTLALGGRMYGREKIEWHDRSWRLLENKGQMEMDDWTYVGMALGVLGAATSETAVKSLGRARAVMGGLGAGGAVGMLGSVVWRVGLNRGKFPEREKEGDL
ncbi:hypothetical protein E4U21_001356 [Claviceps maximensis]|nr:hypothetical protein E4U21_001356 [Claviceps maximensis]